MFYRIPPVGEPIPRISNRRDSEDAGRLFSPYSFKFYASGTQALAAAVMAAIKRKDVRNREVLLPAYTCPAVISAVLYAQARPILVDLEENRPWMDLDQLASKISSQTSAIIAVHLFGIPERLARIREITGDAGLVLIEDSAQRIPGKEEIEQRGDLIVLSFGRGKPVTLLGGGAVLTRDAESAANVPDPGHPAIHALGRIQSIMNIYLYNRFLSPRLFWLPASIPFLHVGETRFVPLRSFTTIDRTILARLPAALWQYQQQSPAIQTEIRRMLCEFKNITDLSAVCAERARLLRYPLLLSSPSLRDTIFQQLSRAGLGASTMYPVPLPRIRGLEELLGEQGVFPGAERFSRNILTLPAHSGVTSEHVKNMGDIFRQIL